LGGIILGRRAGQPVFVANDQKQMMVLAAPSGLALQNSQLFADLQRTVGGFVRRELSKSLPR